MRSVIVGTAGHIDHGKSALVRALTGIDPDRLEEEKRRGITIDLGFAHLKLEGPHGPLQLGFVDVPGHERFVRNMLAGAAGIDIVLLVISAQESVKPQTREHMDICRLLQVRRGITVLTKCDLVDAETLNVVRMEVEEVLSGTFLDARDDVDGSGIAAAYAKARRATLVTGSSARPEASQSGSFALVYHRNHREGGSLRRPGTQGGRNSVGPTSQRSSRGMRSGRPVHHPSVLPGNHDRRWFGSGCSSARTPQAAGAHRVFVRARQGRRQLPHTPADDSAREAWSACRGCHSRDRMDKGAAGKRSGSARSSAGNRRSGQCAGLQSCLRSACRMSYRANHELSSRQSACRRYQ